jgi:hypothetical protein
LLVRLTVVGSRSYVFPSAMGNLKLRSSLYKIFVCWLILFMKIVWSRLGGKVCIDWKKADSHLDDNIRLRKKVKRTWAWKRLKFGGLRLILTGGRIFNWKRSVDLVSKIFEEASSVYPIYPFSLAREKDLFYYFWSIWMYIRTWDEFKTTNYIHFFLCFYNIWKENKETNFLVFPIIYK